MPENARPENATPENATPPGTSTDGVPGDAASGDATSGVEIRRILQTEALVVVDLWDRMCRETMDGGPLTEPGRNNLRRMLEIAAWHRETFCLVAVRSGSGGPEVLGFGLGHVGSGDGLLPGAEGEVQETYVTADVPARAELKARLADAVVEALRDRGAHVIRKRVDVQDAREQRFWAGQGFEADMVVLSLYP